MLENSAPKSAGQNDSKALIGSAQIMGTCTSLSFSAEGQNLLLRRKMVLPQGNAFPPVVTAPLILKSTGPPRLARVRIVWV